MPMRYYEYLSTAKVDMLYPQIDQTSRSAGGEIGFDLKLVKASRKTDGTKEPTAYEKLAAVEAWIYANEPVGNIDEPKAWIYGWMPMAALLVNRAWVTPNPDEFKDSAAVFGARSDERSYILLAGSARHLALVDRICPSSYEEYDLFGSHISMICALIMSYPDTKDQKYPGEETINRLPHMADQLIMRPVDRMLLSRGIGPTYHYEFLAKRLDTGYSDDGRPVTLATPLFVALAD